GQQIKGSGKHSHPCSDTDRRQAELSQLQSAVGMQQFPGEMENQWKAQYQSRASGLAGCKPRHHQGDQQNRQSGNKSRDRTCNADVEQSGASPNRRANANKGAHSPDERGSGEKKRQSRVNMISLGVDEVSHLVSEQNSKKGNAEWHA